MTLAFMWKTFCQATLCQATLSMNRQRQKRHEEVSHKIVMIPWTVSITKSSLFFCTRFRSFAFCESTRSISLVFPLTQLLNFLAEYERIIVAKIRKRATYNFIKRIYIYMEYIYIICTYLIWCQCLVKAVAVECCVLKIDGTVCS